MDGCQYILDSLSSDSLKSSESSNTSSDTGYSI